MSNFSLHPLADNDRNWVRDFIVRHWGSEIVVAHGTISHPHSQPGFAARQHGELAGLVTYQFSGEACEIVTINSLMPGRGLGTALVQAVKQAAARAGCNKLWLITTNDNLPALRFYQKRGFELAAIHRGAVNRSREIKPEIPLVGLNGIPLRDEIELEMRLLQPG